MFLTKIDFEDSLQVIEAYEDLSSEETKMSIATDFARELFLNFESMEDKEKKEVLDMILEDMSTSLYVIN